MRRIPRATPARPVPNRTVPTRPWLPIAIISLILLGGLGYYLYHATRPQPASVARRDIIGYVSLDGRVIAPPSEIADVFPSYQAAVDRVHVTLGEKVAKGETLVELANAQAERTTTWRSATSKRLKPPMRTRKSAMTAR